MGGGSWSGRCRELSDILTAIFLPFVLSKEKTLYCNQYSVSRLWVWSVSAVYGSCWTSGTPWSRFETSSILWLLTSLSARMESLVCNGCVCVCGSYLKDCIMNRMRLACYMLEISNLYFFHPYLPHTLSSHPYPFTPSSLLLLFHTIPLTLPAPFLPFSP